MNRYRSGDVATLSLSNSTGSFGNEHMRQIRAVDIPCLNRMFTHSNNNKCSRQDCR